MQTRSSPFRATGIGIRSNLRAPFISLFCMGAMPSHTIPYHAAPYHPTPHHTIADHTIPHHTYSMVWSGLVWPALVWFGMVWSGAMWYGLVWYGMAPYWKNKIKGVRRVDKRWAVERLSWTYSEMSAGDLTRRKRCQAKSLEMSMKLSSVSWPLLNISAVSHWRITRLADCLGSFSLLLV